MQCDSDVPTAREGRVLQRREVAAAPAQLEGTCVRPVPAGHLAHGRQVNMVIQRPEDLRVACRSTQPRQGYGQSPQSVQGSCRLLQESKTSRAGAEFQHLNPGDHPFTSECNRHQVSRKANANSSTRMISSQRRDSSASKKELKLSNPLLFGLLTETSPNSNGLISTSSSSQKPGPTIELMTATHGSEGHLRSQDVKSSLASPNCGRTRALLQDRPTGSPSAPSEANISSSSLSNYPPTDQSLVAGDITLLPNEPMSHTDARILKLINKRIALLKANRHHSDWDLLNSTSVACCPTTSASDNEVVNKQNPSYAQVKQSTSAAKQVFEENRGEGSKVKMGLTHNTAKRDHTSVSKKHSTEYPQIMLEAAAISVKSEEQSQVVLTAALPRLTTCCNPVQEDISVGLNAKKKLDGKDQVPGAYLPANQLTEKEKGGTGVNLAEVDSTQSVVSLPGLSGYQDANTNKLKNTDLQRRHPASGETAAHSKDNSSTDESNLQESVTANQVEQPVCHKTTHQSFGEIGTGNIQEPAPACKEKCRVTFLKDPQYDDVSDDEDRTVPNNWQCGQRVQGEPVLETSLGEEVIPEKEPRIPAQGCLCPYFVETHSGFECVPCPKCDNERHLGGQTKGSCSPSCGLESEDESSDEMEDDWLVIPLIMSDITLDQVNEDQADPEEVVPDDGEQGEKEGQGATSDLHRPSSNPAPASASPQLEVFVTTQSCTQTQGVQLGNCSEIVPEGSMSNQKIKPSNYESDDSCETDDSCNYSPSLKRNYLTASTQAWKDVSSPWPSEAFESESEKENEEQRAKLIISFNSDTEDESNRSWTNTAKKRKGSFHPCSEASGDESPSRQKGQSSETVDGHCGIVQKTSLVTEHLSNCSQGLPKEKISNGMSERVNTETKSDGSKDGDSKNERRSEVSSESVGVCIPPRAQKIKPGVSPPEPNPLHQAKLQPARSKEAAQAASSKLPRSKKGKPSTEAKARPEHVQQNVKRRATSNEKHKSDKAPQNTSLKRKAKTARRSHSSDSSNTDDSEDAFSDASNSLPASKSKRSGVMNVAEATPGRGLSSDSPETEDSEDVFSDSSDSLCTNKKPQKTPALSKVTAEKRQSADSRTSPSDSRLTIPRLYVQESTQSTQRLKLSKHPQVNRQANNETRATPKTPTAAISRKADDSCRERTLHSLRDKTGRVVHKPKPSNDAPKTTREHKSKPSSSGLIKPSPLNRPPQCSRSYSHPSTSALPSTSTQDLSFSPALHSSAMNKVTDSWKNGFFPIKRRRKVSLGTEDILTSRNHFNRGAIPGPSNAARVRRPAHNLQKSETTLMKRTKFEAKERTRDINLNPQRQKSYPVADHYKWKIRERRQTKGSRRRRRYSSSPSLEDWD